MAIDYKQSKTYQSVLASQRKAFRTAREYDYDINRKAYLDDQKALNGTVIGGVLKVFGTIVGATAGSASAGYTIGDTLAGVLTSAISDSRGKDWKSSQEYYNKSFDSPESNLEKKMRNTGLEVSNKGRTTEFDRQVASRNESFSNAWEYADQRQRYIASAVGNANRTRDSFDRTYGSGMFEKLEGSIMSMLGMDNSTLLSQLVAQFKYNDETIDNITTRILTNEFGKGEFTESQLNEMIASSVNLQNFGSEYTNYLYESVMNMDGSASLEGKALSESENSAIEESEMLAKQTYTQMAEQFASAFLGYRSNNYSMEQSYGQASASEASNGMRASNNTRVSQIAKRFQKDLNRVSYETTLKFLNARVVNQVESMNITRSKVFASSALAKEKIQMQIRNGMEDYYNNFYSSTGDTLYSAGKAQNLQEGYYVSGLATNESVKEMAGKYDYLDDSSFDYQSQIKIADEETK